MSSLENQVQQPEATSTVIRLPVWRQVRWNLIVLLAIFALVPVGIVVSVVLGLTRDQARQQAINQLESVSSLKQAEIVSYLESQQLTLALVEAEVDFFANTLVPVAADTPERRVQALRMVLRSYNTPSVVQPADLPFNTLFAYDTTGTIITSSDAERVGATVQAEPYFTISLAEREYIQPPYLDLSRNSVVLIVTRPILDENGQVIAVLAGESDLTRLGELMTVWEGLGDTGETYLVGLGSSYLLTPSRFPGFSLNQAVRSDGIDRGLRGDSGSGTYTGYRGEPVLGFYRWVPELQAALVAEIDQAEAFEAVNDAQNYSVLLTITMVVIAGVAGLYTASRFSRPITALSRAAQRITAGDLSQRAAVSERSEIGLLGQSFNAMAAQVQELVGSLEDRVANRTHDLFLTIEVGQLATNLYREPDLLPRVTEFIRDQFNLYYVQVYLLDEARLYAVLHAGTGTVGQQLLQRRHRLSLAETSIVSQAVRTQFPVLVPDTEISPIHKPNPLLPDTRSEVAIPLQAAGQILGVLDMQANQPDTFRMDNLPVFEAMASQLAASLSAAQAFQVQERATDVTMTLNRRLTAETWESYLGKVGQGERVGYRYDLGAVTPLDDASAPDYTLERPVLLRDQPIGKLVVGDDQQRPWQPEDLQLIEDVAAYVAQALEQYRAFDETRAALGETASAQHLMRTIIDTTPDWIFAKDRDYRFILVNHACAYEFGRRSPEAMIGKDDYDMGVPAELIEGNPEKGIIGFRADDRRVIEQGETVNNPNDVVVFRDGSRHILNTIKLPMRDARGNVFGMLGVGRDITERLLAEETIRRRAAEMQTVSEVGVQAAASLDPNELLQAVSDLTKERFDLYHAHIYLVDDTGQSLELVAGAGEVGRSMVALGHSIAVANERSLVARAARSREAVVVNDVYQSHDFLPNALLPDTHAELAVPMIAGEQVLGVLDVQADQVDRFTHDEVIVMSTLAAQIAVAVQNARLYAEQVQTTDRLREVDRLKSEFLASMSHELRTPLNSIIGYAEVLLDGIDGDLTDDMQEDVDAIYGSGKHLLNLINDILDLAKIEAGQLDLLMEDLVLRHVAEDSINTTRVLLKDKPVTLALEIRDDLPLVHADPLRVRQILSNLLTNATKFTEQGCITVEAEVYAPNPALLEVRVRDTGIGIQSDKLPQVFDRFRQVDQSHTRRAGGTGLGLSISRQLVQLHGGDIWVESDFGSGSIFHFTLPLAREK